LFLELNSYAMFARYELNERTYSYSWLSLSVFPSAHMFQLEKCSTAFDETMYRHNAIGGYPEFVIFNFVISVVST
jgi:hypothetical protein